MPLSDFIQIVIATFTLATVVAAFLSIRSSTRAASEGLRAEDRAQHQARVAAAVDALSRDMGGLLATLQPFWKDESTRKQFATPPAEVEVHRHIEGIRAGTMGLEATLRIGDESAPEELERLLEAAAICSNASFAMYLAIVPGESSGPFTEEAVRSEVTNGLNDAATREANRILSEAGPTPGYNYAESVMLKSRANLHETLTRYIKAYRGSKDIQNVSTSSLS